MDRCRCVLILAVIVAGLFTWLLFVPRQNVETQIVIQETETLTEKVGGAVIDIAKDQLIKELDERREEDE